MSHLGEMGFFIPRSYGIFCLTLIKKFVMFLIVLILQFLSACKFLSNSNSDVKPWQTNYGKTLSHLGGAGPLAHVHREISFSPW